MTDSTDRVLASIDEAIDGYVSEDWAVSGDAMRWQSEEPEQGDPWIAPEVWDQSVRVDVGASVVDWFSEYFDGLTALPGFQRVFLTRMYESTPPFEFEQRYAHRYDLWSGPLRQALEGAWCTSTWLDELHDGRVYVEGGHSVDAGDSSGVEPRWDDSLAASMERSRVGQPDPAMCGPNPVAVARVAETVGEARRSQPEPELEPLAVNWKVDVGRVSRKHVDRQ